MYIAVAIVRESWDSSELSGRDKPSVYSALESFSFGYAIFGCWCLDVAAYVGFGLGMGTSLPSLPIVVQAVVWGTLLVVLLGLLLFPPVLDSGRWAMVTVYGGAVLLMMRVQRWQSVLVDVGLDDAGLKRKKSAPYIVYVNAAAWCVVVLTAGLAMVRLIVIFSDQHRKIVSGVERSAEQVAGR